ncbi:MAG: thiamine diphosphokinase [Alkalibacterium sp.]|nr:thiamine diphosphokinase [Alkalibacterium sp.]
MNDLDYDSDKDDTDAEIALTLALKDETVRTFSIYNWSGGRFDHLLSILYLIYQPRFKTLIGRLTFYDAANTVSFYEPGEYTIQKETSKKYLSFIGMAPLKELTLKEVKYPLSDQSYAYPRALISNEFLNETCRVSFKEGILAVIQARCK